MPNITLKRFTGSVWEEMLPTPASHTHTYADLTGTVPTWNQNTTGSAASLTTGRTINGTTFNGTANITTANWGTARTLTIGNTGKSVNGSGAVSWSLSEIGAAPTEHAHGVTTPGDLLISYDGSTLSRLGSSGANNRFLKVTLEGSDLIPSWNPILDTDIPNIDTSKLTSGTLGIARGGTGATSLTAGGMLYMNQGGTGMVASPTAGQNNILRATGYNGVHWTPAWQAPVDSAVLAVLSSSGTSIPTERDIYWGTRYIHLGVTTVAGQNVSRTISFTSGMRNFILQLHQDSVTGAVIGRIPLTTTNNAGTSTIAQIYSLDSAASVVHRLAWSNGSSTQIMNVTIQYTGTTITVSHNFNFNAAFRLFGY